MGDEYQLRKDIDKLNLALNELNLDKLNSEDIATEDYVLKMINNIDSNVLQRIGLDKNSSYKFNFATITRIETTLDNSEIVNEEFWILSNAYYDYDLKRFVKVDSTHTSFGIQIQANGTYPGEAQLGYADNVGINFWRNPSHTDFVNSFPNWETDSVYDFTDFMINNHIGVGLKSNSSSWREFGIFSGWNNSFMIDSYGGMTVGGAGFEVDGNGIFPYTRLTSSAFSDGDEEYYLFGLLDNAYHPTVYGWDCDSNAHYSWFMGFKFPSKGYLLKDSENASFIVMYNDTAWDEENVHHIDMSKWHTVFEISTSSVKGIVEGSLTELGSGGASTGWIDCSLTGNFYNFDSAHKLQYIQSGNVVQVNGLAVLNAYPSANEELVITTLPANCRPSHEMKFLCELKDSIKLWTCTIKPNGDVTFNNLRDDTGFISGTAFSDVLSINITYILDD